MAIARWRKAAVVDAAFAPADAEIRGARRFVHAEAAALAFIPLFAAFIPRIYGI
jgi:putative membrane protein